MCTGGCEAHPNTAAALKASLSLIHDLSGPLRPGAGLHGVSASCNALSQAGSLLPPDQALPASTSLQPTSSCKSMWLHECSALPVRRIAVSHSRHVLQGPCTTTTRPGAQTPLSNGQQSAASVHCMCCRILFVFDALASTQALVLNWQILHKFATPFKLVRHSMVETSCAR